MSLEIIAWANGIGLRALGRLIAEERANEADQAAIARWEGEGGSVETSKATWPGSDAQREKRADEAVPGSEGLHVRSAVAGQECSMGDARRGNAYERNGLPDAAFATELAKSLEENPGDVAALRALLALASKTPWRADVDDPHDGGGFWTGKFYNAEDGADGCSWATWLDEHTRHIANVRLVEAAVNALPVLLARIEELEARVTHEAWFERGEWRMRDLRSEPIALEEDDDGDDIPW